MSDLDSSPRAGESMGPAEVAPSASEPSEATGVTPSCGCGSASLPVAGAGSAASTHSAPSQGVSSQGPAPQGVSDHAAMASPAAVALPGSSMGVAVAPSVLPAHMIPAAHQVPPQQAPPQQAPAFVSHVAAPVPAVYNTRLSPALAARGGLSPSSYYPAGMYMTPGYHYVSAQNVSPQSVAAQSVAPLSTGDGAATVPAPAPTEQGSDLVFALGELGYDFGNEARLDYFVQQMGSLSAAMNPMCMAKYLQKQEKVDQLAEKKGGELPDLCPQVADNPEGHEEDANALLWVLNLDDTPTYAIQPDDQFAAKSYDLLTDFLFDQYFDPDEAEEMATEGAKGGGKANSKKADAGNKDAKSRDRLYRVAIAGRLDGTTTLYNGTVVPVIRPVTRGMFNWDADTLLEAILGPKPWSKPKQEESAALQGFLRRIYYEMRNLGQTSTERALNFAGTNAYNSGEVFRSAWDDGLKGLESFEVERSPICRPDSDCWDVKMTFFDPENPYERARWVYRYTIDVSDVMPVAVGTVRSWPIFTNPKS